MATINDLTPATLGNSADRVIVRQAADTVDKSMVLSLFPVSTATQTALDTKLATVSTDATLTGDGTAGDPLVVVGGGGAVDSVNGKTGVVVLDADDISDAATVNKYTTAAEITKLSNIEDSADVTDETNVVSSLDGATLTAVTVLGADKVIIQDTSDGDSIKTVTAQSIADLAPGSGGDVVGPGVAVDSNIALYDGTTGKLLKDGGVKASDFATAAQGSTADSALQNGDNVSDLTNDAGYITSAPVASVNGETGVVVLDTSDIAEVTNLYYTEVRVSANSDVTANTAKISYTDSAAVALNTAKNTYPSADATKLSNIAPNAEVNTINTATAGEPTGSDLVLNVLSLTQAEYDGGSPVATTFYIITDA